MKLHKSFGLIAASLIVPRLLIRYGSKIPEALPGPAIQTMAAKLNHYVLYFLMMFMPATGVAMGIFGGKGIPFFD